MPNSILITVPQYLQNYPPPVPCGYCPAIREQQKRRLHPLEPCRVCRQRQQLIAVIHSKLLSIHEDLPNQLIILGIDLLMHLLPALLNLSQAYAANGNTVTLQQTRLLLLRFSFSIKTAFAMLDIMYSTQGIATLFPSAL